MDSVQTLHVLLQPTRPSLRPLRVSVLPTDPLQLADMPLSSTSYWDSQHLRLQPAAKLQVRHQLRGWIIHSWCLSPRGDQSGGHNRRRFCVRVRAKQSWALWRDFGSDGAWPQRALFGIADTRSIRRGLLLLSAHKGIQFFGLSGPRKQSLQL